MQGCYRDDNADESGPRDNLSRHPSVFVKSSRILTAAGIFLVSRICVQWRRGLPADRSGKRSADRFRLWIRFYKFLLAADRFDSPGKIN